jgi:acetyl esterase
MAIDPQIQAMLAAAPPWPGVRSMELSALRAAVHDSSVQLPPAGDAAVASVEDRSIDGPGGRLGLRLYTPPGQGPFPITVYMHGGGYVVGDLDTQDMIARALCAWGETLVVSVDYRLAPEHPFPAAPDDCWAALQWVAAHADSIGGDPKRLAVAGDSAGGNLAAALALRARDAGGPVLRAMINLYGSCNYPSTETASAREFATGPILTRDDVDWFWEQYLEDPAIDQHDPQASPVRAASLAGLAPAFVGVPECDPSRDDTLAFGAALAAAGNGGECKLYPGMVHGFASWVAFLPGALEVLNDAARFLRSRFATEG